MIDRTLTGKRVVVTRPRHQARPLVEALESRGASVIEAPAIRIAPPSDFAPLDEAIARLATYDWVVFTSANGVSAFFDRREAIRPEPAERLSSVSFAAIGPATAESLREHGYDADVVPERYVAEEVFRALLDRTEIAGKSFLLPRADIARAALPDLLEKAGALVDVVAAYRTLPADEEGDRVAELIRGDEIDIVTFTSASTARSFFAAVDPSLVARGRGIAAASIGPITSRALRDLGVEPAIEADPFTVPGLVEAIVRYCAESRPPPEP